MACRFRRPLKIALMNGILSDSAFIVRDRISNAYTMHMMAQEATYELEDNMRILSEALDLVELRMVANDSLHTKLRLEDLGLFSVTDEDGDVESTSARVAKKSSEDSASDVACSRTGEPHTWTSDWSRRPYLSRQ